MPVGEDDLEIGDLVTEIEDLTAADLARIKRIATEHPMLVDRLINKEGTTTAVNIEVHLSKKTREEIGEI